MEEKEFMINVKGFLGLCLWKKDDIGWTLIDSDIGLGTNETRRRN